MSNTIRSPIKSVKDERVMMMMMMMMMMMIMVTTLFLGKTHGLIELIGHGLLITLRDDNGQWI